MSFQKIFLLGAGAIGTTYGALLSEGNDVTLISRKAHVDAINKNGLSLSGSANNTLFVEADTSIKEIPSDTLILLTTKAQDAAGAVISIEPLLRRDTVILVLQNGLGIKEMVERVVGDEYKIVRGLVTLAAEFFEPGKISFWPGKTILETTQTSERIAGVFNESGLTTKISNQMHEEMWKKLIVNCVVNPLTAILRIRNNEIMVDSLKETRRQIIQECTAVGKAEGIGFESNLENPVERRIGDYGNYSSMCQDLVKGKKTEIDFINGKIVELARKHDIPAPVNEALVGLIRFLEERQG